MFINPDLRVVAALPTDLFWCAALTSSNMKSWYEYEQLPSFDVGTIP